MKQRRALRGPTDRPALQDLREHAHGHVTEAVLPALLLAQPGLGVGRQLARHTDAGQEQRPPALHPAAIGKVEILGDRVALPTAAGVDRRPLPDSTGTVEGERVARPAARRLLDAEMSVEGDHLHLGERILARIEEIEPGLHEGEVRLGEEWPHADAQEVGRRHIVDVEDGKEVVWRLLHRLVQRAALVARPIGALERHDIEAPRPELGGDLPDHLGRLVRAVVEKLDVKLVARPVQGGSGFGASAHDSPLVEGRNLNHHVGQVGIGRQRRREQHLLAMQAGLLQPMVQHDHVEQAADEGSQQHATDREYGAEEKSEDRKNGHRSVSCPSWACG